MKVITKMNNRVNSSGCIEEVGAEALIYHPAGWGLSLELVEIPGKGVTEEIVAFSHVEKKGVAMTPLMQDKIPQLRAEANKALEESWDDAQEVAARNDANYREFFKGVQEQRFRELCRVMG